MTGGDEGFSCARMDALSRKTAWQSSYAVRPCELLVKLQRCRKVESALAQSPIFRVQIWVRYDLVLKVLGEVSGVREWYVRCKDFCRE